MEYSSNTEQAEQGLMDTFEQTSTLLFPTLPIQLTKCCRLKPLLNRVKIKQNLL
ncbi:hypothetical protein DPMN_138770 [Dreissena polymorpha]|uniref:Uncharacterized protein n=1 Tax=Dreissena polymorpha TaxID=45954 RepID=A0A9D4G7W7_DREPO|nr:hypothetical protein DPMN_138765 [Dreissena polymorpha]KAH3810378.1 hypothetical protein DPMN_138770 [Dreissena polymorpha]